MQDGDCAAALLSKAFVVIASAAGCHELPVHPDPWDCYQGGVFAARTSWIAAHAADVSGFIRATLAATDWVLAPANWAKLPGLLMAHLLHMTDEAAAEAADNLDSLLARDLPINIAGLRSVIALRKEYGSPLARLGGPEYYLDLSLYEGAMESR